MDRCNNVTKMAEIFCKDSSCFKVLGGNISQKLLTFVERGILFIFSGRGQ